MFAYYREKEKKNITPKSLNESISINLYSSNFSYAEIPKIFKNIIGVTGTLKTLSDFEKKIITEDYNIKLNTYIQSNYSFAFMQPYLPTTTPSFPTMLLAI